ncbi:MAG TPA: hypothetical protein VKV15_18610 [Bryobacteraceae bacterium]|nr:hypothetical protein [Bryobacteraceae bacterium]
MCRTLLLFCIVDALGGYLALDKNNDIPKGEPFRVLNHPLFGLTLTTDQIERLEWWYRNGLAHNASVPPGTCLTGEEGQSFDFAVNGDPIKIRVYSFTDWSKERGISSIGPDPGTSSPREAIAHDGF